MAATFMDERCDQRIGPDFDGASPRRLVGVHHRPAARRKSQQMAGPCHHIALSLSRQTHGSAAPPLYSPPVCFSFSAVTVSGVCSSWEKTIYVGEMPGSLNIPQQTPANVRRSWEGFVCEEKKTIKTNQTSGGRLVVRRQVDYEAGGGAVGEGDLEIREGLMTGGWIR